MTNYKNHYLDKCCFQNEKKHNFWKLLLCTLSLMLIVTRSSWRLQRYCCQRISLCCCWGCCISESDATLEGQISTNFQPKVNIFKIWKTLLTLFPILTLNSSLCSGLTIFTTVNPTKFKKCRLCLFQLQYYKQTQASTSRMWLQGEYNLIRRNKGVIVRTLYLILGVSGSEATRQERQWKQVAYKICLFYCEKLLLVDREVLSCQECSKSLILRYWTVPECSWAINYPGRVLL